MSISFEKNRTKLIEAWKDVLNHKSSTDWAIFGYEGHTNELKVVETGEGGVDEISEDLNTGKIMYVFLRVSDPKTTLTKFVLINWQGDGAPVARKGLCANHIRDVSNFFHGHHLTLSARNEDELDNEILLKKVSGVGSAYNFKQTIHHDEQQKPVGTNWNKLEPKKELNSKESEDFWKKESEEEKHRIEIESERKKVEMEKLEKEQRVREEREHKERENLPIEKLQSAYKPIKTSPQPLSPVKQLPSPIHTISEAEKMRQLRNQEARELIGTKVGTAKAIFTQNTVQDQSQKNIPLKPARNSISQRINALNNQQEIKIETKDVIIESENIVSVKEIDSENSEIYQNDEQFDDLNNKNHLSTAPYEEEQFSTIKRSPQIKNNSTTVQQSEQKEADEQKTLKTVANELTTNALEAAENELTANQHIEEEYPNYSNGGLKARALYDYQAADESEITFDPGDIITHIDQIDEGWWQGLGPDGISYGLFPANYVELIN